MVSWWKKRWSNLTSGFMYVPFAIKPDPLPLTLMPTRQWRRWLAFIGSQFLRRCWSVTQCNSLWKFISAKGVARNGIHRCAWNVGDDLSAATVLVDLSIWRENFFLKINFTSSLVQWLLTCHWLWRIMMLAERRPLKILDPAQMHQLCLVYFVFFFWLQLFSN
jgi:hypothetical protein